MTEFFEELYKQIYVTFLHEERWRFFVDGFWMTLFLTFTSFILGTLIGILLCKLKMAGYKWVRRVMKIFTVKYVRLIYVINLISLLLIHLCSCQTAHLLYQMEVSFPLNAKAF